MLLSLCLINMYQCNTTKIPFLFYTVVVFKSFNQSVTAYGANEFLNGFKFLVNCVVLLFKISLMKMFF